MATPSSTIVQAEIDYLGQPTTVVNYIPVWKRQYISKLLSSYLADLSYKKDLLDRLGKDANMTEELKKLRTQLKQEEDNLLASKKTSEALEKKYKEDLDKLKKEHTNMRRLASAMLQFIKSQKHAFFGWLAEHHPGLFPSWNDFQQVFSAVDIPMMLEFLELLTIDAPPPASSSSSSTAPQ